MNVETARLAIATQYFEQCDAECTLGEIVSTCPGCGRSPDRIVPVASGTGDGAYPVLRLLDEALATVGVLTGFMDSLDAAGLAGRITGLEDLFASSAPMILGTLDCQGTLLVHEATKALDDPDVSVDVAVPPGAYTVVCWVSEPPFRDDLLPIAVAAVAGELRERVLRKVPAIDDSVRSRLIGEMWGDDDRLVDSLLADIRPSMLMKNIQLSSGHDPQAALSWAAHFAENYEHDGVWELLQESFGGWASGALEVLEWRGTLEPRLPWWKPTMQTEPLDPWHQVQAARDTSEPLDRGILESNRWARRSAARRVDLGTALAAPLASDQDSRVRLNLAANGAVVPEILMILANDPDPAVRTAARDNQVFSDTEHLAPARAVDMPAPAIAVRAFSTNYPVLANLGGQLAHLGELDLAEIWIRRGIDAAIDAGDSKAAAAAANTLAFSVLMPQDRTDDARRVLQQAVEYAAGYESVNALSNLGIIEYGEGNLDNAAALFERVLEERGPVEEAHYYLGLIMRTAGNSSASREHFQQAVAGDDPEYAQRAKEELASMKRRWWR